MPDDSLYSKHLRILTEDQSRWTQADHEEFLLLQSLDLPKLNLSNCKTAELTWWKRIRGELQLGNRSKIIAMAACAVAIGFFVPLIQSNHDTLVPKGSLQVSVFWQHDGITKPWTEMSNLQDGDKVGASVISSEESTAYWLLTDKSMNTIEGTEDIESSQLNLKPGQSQSFDSSFQLTAPNQGENLLVIVCPQTMPGAGKMVKSLLLDHDFTDKILLARRLSYKDCSFSSFKLRSSP